MFRTSTILWVRKLLSVAVISALLIAPLGRGYVVRAQDASGSTATEAPSPSPSPSDTPTPTPGSTDVTNDTTQVTNDVTSAGNTGGNTVATPSATPTEPPVPPATGSASFASTSALLLPLATPSATPTQNPQQGDQSGDHHDEGQGNSGPDIRTGDAVSVTTADTSVNTTVIDAKTVHQTINIFVPLSSPVDLSLAAMQATARALSGPQANDGTINLGITVDNHMVTVDNTVASQAISGYNTSEGDGSSVRTGDAASIVSLFNSVNTTIINSTIHIYTINIFTVTDTDIILPDPMEATGSAACCSQNISVENGDTTLTNSVDSLADTGNNTILGSGAITTGDAKSAVNVTNMVNTTLTNAVFYQLFINVFGVWDGRFLQWGDIAATGAGSMNVSALLQGYGGDDCGCIGDVRIRNGDTTVSNSVGSLAQTGGNTASGEGSSISTGNAYSAVNIVNLINSTFINTYGFFGFINIFGTLHGDIGGAQAFITPTPTPAPETASQQTQDENQKPEEPRPHESGGALTVTNTNNVAAWVLPGDTVTFFVTAKNIGTGTVYNAAIDLGLLDQDGNFAGGRHYEVGDIDLNSGVKLTTGFVLSPTTPPGIYTARAIVSGVVGPDDTKVSAYADSSFRVFGTVLSSQTGPSSATGSAVPSIPKVLGTTTRAPRDTSDILMALAVLLLLAPVYKSYLILKNPWQIGILFAPRQSLLYRFRALLTLLL